MGNEDRKVKIQFWSAPKGDPVVIKVREGGSGAKARVDPVAVQNSVHLVVAPTDSVGPDPVIAVVAASRDHERVHHVVLFVLEDVAMPHILRTLETVGGLEPRT